MEKTKVSWSVLTKLGCDGRIESQKMTNYRLVTIDYWLARTDYVLEPKEYQCGMVGEWFDIFVTVYLTQY